MSEDEERLLALEIAVGRLADFCRAAFTGPNADAAWSLMSKAPPEPPQGIIPLHGRAAQDRHARIMQRVAALLSPPGPPDKPD